MKRTKLLRPEKGRGLLIGSITQLCAIGILLATAVFMMVPMETIAVPFFIAFWTGVGIALIHCAFAPGMRNAARKLFYICFFLYLIFSLVTYYGCVDDPFTTFFMSLDSTVYYKTAVNLGSQSSVSTIWQTAFSEYRYSEFPLYAFFIGVVEQTGRLLGGGGYLIQKIHVVFFSAMIPVFLFGMLHQYIETKKAWNAALLYALASFTLFFSAQFMRDPHISFLFAWVLFLIHKKDRKKCESVLGWFLCLICYFIRAEHGLFLFLLYSSCFFSYLLNKFRNNPYLGAAVVGAALLASCILAYTLLSDRLSTVGQSMEAYTDRNISLATSDSIGVKLAKLPPGIRQVVCGAYSQIQPFPVWYYFAADYQTKNQWLCFPVLACSFTSFFSLVFIAFGMTLKSVRAKCPRPILIQTGLALILVLGASAEINIRRMYCVYPSIYLLSAYCYFTNKQSKAPIIWFGICALIGLHFLYCLLKG